MHFYTTVNNSRGKPVGTGAHAKSGQTAWVRSYSTGVKVQAKVIQEKDLFLIFATGGSGSGTEDIFLGTVLISKFGRPMFSPAKINGGAP